MASREGSRYQSDGSRPGKRTLHSRSSSVQAPMRRRVIRTEVLSAALFTLARRIRGDPVGDECRGRHPVTTIRRATDPITPGHPAGIERTATSANRRAVHGRHSAAVPFIAGPYLLQATLLDAADKSLATWELQPLNVVDGGVQAAPAIIGTSLSGAEARAGAIVARLRDESERSGRSSCQCTRSCRPTPVRFHRWE